MRAALGILLAAFAICPAQAETLLEWNFYDLIGAASTTNWVYSTYNNGNFLKSGFLSRQSGLLAGLTYDHTLSIRVLNTESSAEAQTNHVSFYFGISPSQPDVWVDSVEMKVGTWTNSSPVFAGLFYDPVGSAPDQQVGSTVTIGVGGTIKEILFDNLNLHLTNTNGFTLCFWSSNQAYLTLGDPNNPNAVGLRVSSIPEARTASLMAVSLVGLFAGAGLHPLFFRRAKFRA